MYETDASPAYLWGRALGTFLTPILLGLLIAFIWAKLKKKPFSWKIALIAAVILFVLSSLGSATQSLPV